MAFPAWYSVARDPLSIRCKMKRERKKRLLIKSDRLYPLFFAFPSSTNHRSIVQTILMDSKVAEVFSCSIWLTVCKTEIKQNAAKLIKIKIIKWRSIISFFFLSLERFSREIAVWSREQPLEGLWQDYWSHFNSLETYHLVLIERFRSGCLRCRRVSKGKMKVELVFLTAILKISCICLEPSQMKLSANGTVLERHSLCASSFITRARPISFSLVIVCLSLWLAFFSDDIRYKWWLMSGGN